MSAFQKSFAKAKLAGLPFHPPLPPNAGGEVLAEEDDDEAEEAEDQLKPLPRGTPETRLLGETREDDSSSASSASSTGSTGTIKPEIGRRLFARPKGASSETAQSRYAPVPWTAYFDQEIRLSSEDSAISHHVYFTPPGDSSAPLFVMHHGAGSSGLSFAACAVEMRRQAPNVGIVSIDARGHGDTKIIPRGSRTDTRARADSEGTVNSYQEQKLARKQGEDKDGVLDLSLATLGADLERVLKLLAVRMGWKDLPHLLLVGHSLGGAVVTHVAKEGRLGNKVLGYVVLDVVEGSAIDALQSMQTYLSTRPKHFPSVEAAIEWHLRSRTIRTSESARVSVPSLLREAAPPPSPPRSPGPFNPVTLFPSTHPNTFSTTPVHSSLSSASACASSTDSSSAASQSSNTNASVSISTSPTSPSHAASSTAAFSAPVTDPCSPISPANIPRFAWRTDLRSTAPFWEDWFVGLSQKFLTARGGKLLLLAGTDRLDKELMIGQMQGKYQLQVYPDAGHFIHEDLPAKTATALIEFWKRQDGRTFLPPKISDKLRRASHGLAAG